MSSTWPGEEGEHHISRFLCGTNSEYELVQTVRCSQAGFRRWEWQDGLTCLPLWLRWQAHRRSGFPETLLDCGGCPVILASRLWLLLIWLVSWSCQWAAAEATSHLAASFLRQRRQKFCCWPEPPMALEVSLAFQACRFFYNPWLSYQLRLMLNAYYKKEISGKFYS